MNILTDRRFGDSFALPLAGPAPSAWMPIGVGERPAHRNGAAGVYHPPGNRLVLYGGYSGTDGRWDQPESLSDLWVLPLASGGEWRRVELQAPPPRNGHTAIYDPVSDQMVVFGGSNKLRTAREVNNEVWMLRLGALP
jgi:hypothetical protein